MGSCRGPGAARGAEGRLSSPSKREGSGPRGSAGCCRLPQARPSHQRALRLWNPAGAPARSQVCGEKAPSRPPRAAACSSPSTSRRWGARAESASRGNPRRPSGLRVREGGGPTWCRPPAFREGLRAGARGRAGRDGYPTRGPGKPTRSACAPRRHSHPRVVTSPFPENQGRSPGTPPPKAHAPAAR